MRKKAKFLTYEEQLDLLRDHGLEITNNKIGQELLQSRGYYNLINRYKNDLYENGSHTYPPYTTLEDIFRYQRMEEDFRNILFRFTLDLERRLKENMSYAIAKNIGINPKKYLNPRYFNTRHAAKTEKILGEFTYILKNTKSNPTKYYREKYDVVPPWILLNNAMFGETRMLWGILASKLKKQVLLAMLPINKFENNQDDNWNEYVYFHFSRSLDKELTLAIKNNDQEKQDILFSKNEDRVLSLLIELFSTMIRSINDFRNALAHGDRILHFRSRYNLRLAQINMLLESKISKSTFLKDNLGNGLFAILLVLVFLLDKYDVEFLLRQLSNWQYQNTRSEKDKKTYNLLIKNFNLPQKFIKKLNNIHEEIHYISKHHSKYDDYY